MPPDLRQWSRPASVSRRPIDSQSPSFSSQSSYVVQTPSSTAAIRGTTFTTYANGAVLVFDGCVDVVMVDPVTKREARYGVCAGQMFDQRFRAWFPSRREFRLRPSS